MRKKTRPAEATVPPPLAPTFTHQNLNTAEAAAYLRVSRRTLETLRLEGTGPVFCRVGKRVIVYRKADLENYLAQTTRTCSAGDRRIAVAKQQRKAS